MKVKIYQINYKFDKCDYVFLGWRFAKDKFNFKDYDLMYELTVDENDDGYNGILEDMFYIFNAQKPEDFKGHSLSVSDIVQVGDLKFYCDEFGWQRLRGVK